MHRFVHRYLRRITLFIAASSVRVIFKLPCFSIFYSSCVYFLPPVELWHFHLGNILKLMNVGHAK